MRKLQLASLTLLFTLVGLTQARATGDSVTVLSYLDTIFIQIDSIFGKYFMHRVAPKQTLYSLCRFYGLKTTQLQELNPALKVRMIQVDELLKVPISAKLIRVTELPKNRASFTPVFYEVKPSEGLLNISRNYFGIKPEKLMKLNGMTSPELKLGQLLLLGWVPLDIFSKKVEAPIVSKPVDKTVPANKSNPSSINNTVNSAPAKSPIVETSPKSTEKDKAIIKTTITEAVAKVEKEEAKTNTPASNKEKFEEASTVLKRNNEQGAAFWHKELKGSKGLYVLHKSAAVGSIISITNPMFNTTIYAKVAGTIPANTYPDDIKVIVSPEVAAKLGAKDAKFFTRISYLK